MESSCLSFITVCRKLLGISLESVVRVRWMDLLYARVIKVHAVCLRQAPMLGQSIQTAQCMAKPSLLLSPSLCSCSNSLSKYPSQHRLLPPLVLSPYLHALPPGCWLNCCWGWKWGLVLFFCVKWTPGVGLFNQHPKYQQFWSQAPLVINGCSSAFSSRK